MSVRRAERTNVRERATRVTGPQVDGELKMMRWWVAHHLFARQHHHGHNVLLYGICDTASQIF